MADYGDFSYSYFGKRKLILSKVRRTIRLIFGWLFIFLGVLGLFLPVLQGILFLVVGSLLLSPEIPLFQKIHDRLHEKFPKLREKAHRLRSKFGFKEKSTREK